MRNHHTADFRGGLPAALAPASTGKGAQRTAREDRWVNGRNEKQRSASLPPAQEGSEVHCSTCAEKVDSCKNTRGLATLASARTHIRTYLVLSAMERLAPVRGL